MFTTPTPADRHLLGLVAELGRAGRGLQHGEVFCEGVTFTQFYILELIDQHDCLPMAQLHTLLAVDKSTTTRLIAPLIERELVERHPAPSDSRAALLSLSESGQQTLGRLWACVAEVLEAIRSAIPEADRENVLTSVMTFLTILKTVCRPGCC